MRTVQKMTSRRIRLDEDSWLTVQGYGVYVVNFHISIEFDQSRVYKTPNRIKNKKEWDSRPRKEMIAR